MSYNKIKKTMLLAGVLCSTLIPSTSAFADKQTEYLLNNPVNVYETKEEAMNRGEEKSIYIPGYYLIYDETEDAINLANQEDTPGAWILKEDIYKENTKLAKVKEDTDIFYKSNTGKIKSSDEIIESGKLIDVEDSKEEGFVLFGDDYISEDKLEFLELTEENQEVYFLDEDAEFKSKDGEVIGKEEPGYKVYAYKDGNTLRFIYNGKIVYADSSLFIDYETFASRATAVSYIYSYTDSDVPVNGAPYYPDVKIEGEGDNIDAVNLALQQVGKPYIFATSGPTSFDCSGLVKYVFAHTRGIGLPHLASSQQQLGVEVPRDEMQAGDLIFFGSPAYHVGIYMGNGQYVHASSPSTGVIISDINYAWGRISNVRRY